MGPLMWSRVVDVRHVRRRNPQQLPFAEDQQVI
jgi:hypothetical protein